MKISQTILSSILLLAGGALAARHGSPITETAAVESSQNPGRYDIGLQVSQSRQVTTWRYTLTKIANETGDLGHFIVDFGSCQGRSPTIANILSATVNGVDWLNQITNTEGKTGCEVGAANFVKFN